MSTIKQSIIDFFIKEQPKFMAFIDKLVEKIKESPSLPIHDFILILKQNPIFIQKESISLYDIIQTFIDIINRKRKINIIDKDKYKAKIKEIVEYLEKNDTYYERIELEKETILDKNTIYYDVYYNLLGNFNEIRDGNYNPRDDQGKRIKERGSDSLVTIPTKFFYFSSESNPLWVGHYILKYNPPTNLDQTGGKKITRRKRTSRRRKKTIRHRHRKH